jgi:hypothetical protein
MEFNIPCITSLDTAKAILQMLEHLNEEVDIIPLNRYADYTNDSTIRPALPLSI